MSKYTPLFDSLTKGTLCGKWPDIGLWPIILSMADWNGTVDVTPLYIAGVTGLPEQDVIDCMARFCEPDKYSRSQDCDGRRLELLDDHRDWGWRVINHSKYREKARLSAKNAREVAEEKNKKRMRDRRRPPETTEDPLLNININKNTSGEIPSVSVVFEHWKTTHNHKKSKLDSKRKKLIAARLKDYSVEDLCESITGYLNSPHHMGENDKQTRYDDIELFLRDAKRVDAGIAFAQGPVQSNGVSGKTRQKLQGAANWKPKELRQ